MTVQQPPENNDYLWVLLAGVATFVLIAIGWIGSRSEEEFWKMQGGLNRFQRAVNVCIALPNVDKAQECLARLENIERQYKIAIKKLEQEHRHAE